MRIFCTTLLVGLFTTFGGWAQKSGITFRQGALAEVFQQARRAGKPVFVEMYSPSCHVCQSFVPTLADPQVGKFYNARFISTKVDINSRDAQAFLESRRLFVPSLPLFLYFDAQQNLIHFALSTNTPAEVIRHGTVALNPQQRSQTMPTRFANGERSNNFLIDYGMYTRITRDTATNIRVLEEYARRQPAGSFASQTNWLVLQKLVLDMDNPLFRYMLDNPKAYRPYGVENARNVAENILMSSLYSSRGAQYPAQKVLQVKQGLTKIGIDAKVAANRTLLPEVNAYFRARQGAKATARMDAQVANAVEMTVPEFLYILRLFNRQSPDAHYVPTAARWVNKALQLKPSPREQADLYYELAEAYRRQGNTAEAAKAARKSLDLAQAAQLDTRRNSEQLSRLK